MRTITHEDLLRIRMKYADYPQIDLLYDDTERSIFSSMARVKLCMLFIDTFFEPAQNLNRRTTSFRVYAEKVLAPFGYIGKMHMLAAYEMLGVKVGNFDGPYFDAKIKLRRNYRSAFALDLTGRASKFIGVWNSLYPHLTHKSEARV